MAELDDAPVLEGFICPICKRDLGDTAKLLNHFQDDHSEEQDFIKAFKDLYDKAKKKILKQDSQIAAAGNHVRHTSAFSSDYTHDPQEIGVTFSHKKLFESIREEWMQRLSVPTNQLIIRLERLLANMPSDPVKRKAHEQNVVAWIDGDAVDRCPNCAGMFYLARRKHHCRTCGSIMCNDCSHFMALNTARRILEKPVEEEVQGITEAHLRLCIHCITLLEKREERREMKSIKPIISQFYQRLTEYRQQADLLRQQYLKMLTSLNAGESVYSLEEAQVVKVKLLKLAENIDSLSSRIAVLGKGTEQPPQGQALRLQNMVRSSAATYLKNQLLKLPGLPSEEEFAQAQEKRRKATAARIKEEKMRQARLNNIVNNTKSGAVQKQSTDPTVSLGQGWVPEKMKVNESEDPLMEQINIIRSYIKEAKAAHKYDEVASLEENLHELKKEFWKKQTQQEDYTRSGESSEAASLSSYEEVRQSESSHGDSSH